LKSLKNIAKTLLMCVTLLFVKIVKILKRKFIILLELWISFQREKSNFENVLASQNYVFGRVGLGFNPQNKQDSFSKKFSKLSVKQPIVTCFYCMKRGHSVRFCKIRKYFFPRGFMKWIPKGCEVSNDKNKSSGPTFVRVVRGPNLVA